MAQNRNQNNRSDTNNQMNRSRLNKTVSEADAKSGKTYMSGLGFGFNHD